MSKQSRNADQSPSFEHVFIEDQFCEASKLDSRKIRLVLPRQLLFFAASEENLVNQSFVAELHKRKVEVSSRKSLLPKTMPTFQVNPKYAVMTQLTDGLFICGVSSLKPQLLENCGISCVINCTKEVPNLNAPEGERLKLWLDDTEETDLYSYLDMVVDRIHEIIEEGGKVLIHCVAGVSRSAAFALAYLVKYEHLSLRQAYKFCAVKRPLVRPNLGFWKQLIEYESYVRGSISVNIVSYGLAEEDGEVQHLPDVYLDEIRSKENSPPVGQVLDGVSCKRRRSSAAKFIPRLASVPEIEP